MYLKHLSSFGVRIEEGEGNAALGFVPGPFDCSLYLKKSEDYSAPWPVLVLTCGSPDSLSRGLTLSPGSLKSLHSGGGVLTVECMGESMAADTATLQVRFTYAPSSERLVQRCIAAFNEYWSGAVRSRSFGGGGGGTSGTSSSLNFSEKRAADVLQAADGIHRILQLASRSRKARGVQTRSTFRAERLKELLVSFAAEMSQLSDRPLPLPSGEVIWPDGSVRQPTPGQAFGERAKGDDEEEGGGGGGGGGRKDKAGRGDGDDGASVGSSGQSSVEKVQLPLPGASSAQRPADFGAGSATPAASAAATAAAGVKRMEAAGGGVMTMTMSESSAQESGGVVASIPTPLPSFRPSAPFNAGRGRGGSIGTSSRGNGTALGAHGRPSPTAYAAPYGRNSTNAAGSRGGASSARDWAPYEGGIMVPSAEMDAGHEYPFVPSLPLTGQPLTSPGYPSASSPSPKPRVATGTNAAAAAMMSAMANVAVAAGGGSSGRSPYGGSNSGSGASWSPSYRSSHNGNMPSGFRPSSAGGGSSGDGIVVAEAGGGYGFAGHQSPSALQLQQRAAAVAAAAAHMQAASGGYFPPPPPPPPPPMHLPPHHHQQQPSAVMYGGGGGEGPAAAAAGAGYYMPYPAAAGAGSHGGSGAGGRAMAAAAAAAAQAMAAGFYMPNMQGLYGHPHSTGGSHGHAAAIDAHAGYQHQHHHKGAEGMCNCYQCVSAAAAAAVDGTGAGQTGSH